MKKTVLIAFFSLGYFCTKAQKDWKNSDIANKAGDHIMLQLTSSQWSGVPDSIRNYMGGFARGANVYVMINKPFKTSPQLSIAFGVGVGTANIYFKKMNVDIKSKENTLPFTKLDTTNRFKKYKLTTAYLEIPVEFRFTANPAKENKSIKIALGGKVGTLVNAHTKGKILQDKDGKNINSFTQKETSKKFFNSTRLAVTGRVGYGNFSLYGSYQLNELFKDGVAPAIKPFEIGLCLSGL